MTDTPDDRQCTLPSCEREKVNPSERGGLCKRHLPTEDGAHTTEEPGTTDANPQGGDDETPRHLQCLADALEFFHTELDATIDDHTEDGQHPDRPTTAREYFSEHRGWDDATIDDKLLGWAPADEYALRDHLMQQGYEKDDLRATGLFYENLTPHFQGRYVFPYFDHDGQPVYAISRSVDASADGHPGDMHGGQKYTKAVKTKDYSRVDEPIYGTETMEPGQPVIITEGMADAITAHEAGYACISPVTKQFKTRHQEPLLELFEEHDTPRVYVVQDNERAGFEVRETTSEPDAITDALNIKQYGEGLTGAIETGALLADHDIDVRVAELPRPGGDKTDLDDYLIRWNDSLTPVLASARPVTQHPAYHDLVGDASRGKATAIEAAERTSESAEQRAGTTDSALFDLTITDVAPVSEGYRGKNPLGHHGDSETYYVVIGDGELGYDHKHKAAYNGLTHLLCEARERRPATPNGQLTDEELFVAWREAKANGHLGPSDPIPHAALKHVGLKHGVCDSDDIEDGWRLPRSAFNDALVLVEEQHGVEPGRTFIAEPGDGPGHAIETCEPPIHNPEPLDVDERREEIEARYDDYIAADQPVIFGDHAGTGKTTTTAIAAARRERDHAVLFQNHKKAREFQTDDVTPDGYFHLKGGAQKREDACMDADHADRDCPRHQHNSECPHMCPIYDRDKEDDTRQQYEALASEVGPVKAHQMLELHNDVKCAWLKQFDGLEHKDRIVGVHEYQRLKTVRADRDVIIDEQASPLADDRTLGVDDLVRTGNLLERLAELHGEEKSENLEAFADFTDNLVALITDPDAPDTLDQLEPPDVNWKTFIDVKDPISGAGEKKQLSAETLAELKVEFSETILGRMQPLEGWEGTPICMDTILLAAREAGLHDTAVRRAVAAPISLDHCPWCHSQTDAMNGARVCTDCGWAEQENTILKQDSERARGNVRVKTDHEDRPLAIDSRVLPLQSELPSEPLVLNATPNPSAVEGLYGAEPVVMGDGPVEANMHVTAAMDGQYHHSTVAQSTSARRRIQNTIDTAANVHDKVLVIGKKDARSMFDFPDNTDWLHYHANRGLNRSECDAVICIGAPHPAVDDLERMAELLAMDTDMRVGGEEHSTRADAPNPPVYRKLLFEDDNGQGRAVPTKAYTGLVGDMFRASREDELVQATHRIRPVLADDTKHVYLLTNVPTDIPIDSAVTFDELADPIQAMLPVPERAVTLLKHAHEALQGNAPDGFRAEALVDERDGELVNNKSEFHRLAQVNGMDVSRKTVNEWVNALEAIGLLEAGDYVQREGVRYSVSRATLNSALQVVSGNGGLKVAAVRRLRRKIADAGSVDDWLEWARGVFDLSGDRCDVPIGADAPGTSAG